MFEAAEAFAARLFTEERWPLWSAVLVLTIIGQFTSLKLFTRTRAYTKGRWQWLWWWGRETLMLHPIAAGFVLGFLWPDPEGAGWTPFASKMYFASAGVISLTAWSVLRGVLKKRGHSISLPGMSDRPKPE